MRFRHFVLMGVGLSLSLPAFAGTSEITAAQEPDRYLSAGQIEDYHVAGGDKVRITVFNEPSLSGEFAVSSDGKLSLPLIGEVNVLGKTTTDIAGQVQAELADGYLKSPKVSADVTLYRPFFILGEVKSPGNYPYASGLTVLNAVATAQGFTPRAQRKTVFIKRAGSSQEETFKLSPDLRVLPGDTIRLGERYF